MFVRILCSVILLAFVTAASRGQVPIEKGTPVKAVEEIRGKFEDDKDLPKMKAAPMGPIADAASFTKLWKEWKGDAAQPKIDFKKQFVMVGTTQCAANRIFGGFSRSAEGEFRGTFGSTLIGGPGFAYVICVFDRDGVKTVNGKPLPAPKE